MQNSSTDDRIQWTLRKLRGISKFEKEFLNGDGENYAI